jgi:hypothetical protein
MGDIFKSASDKAWEKDERSILATDRKIEQGVTGETLAALHGLRASSGDQLACDIDESSESDDQATLRGKIIERFIGIDDSISRNRHVDGDVKQQWTTRLQQCQPDDPKCVASLRELRQDIDRWGEIEPQSELSLIYVAIGAVTMMADVYRRRFCSE